MDSLNDFEKILDVRFWVLTRRFINIYMRKAGKVERDVTQKNTAARHLAGVVFQTH
jgi:hypothetical protein